MAVERPKLHERWRIKLNRRGDGDLIHRFHVCGLADTVRPHETPPWGLELRPEGMLTAQVGPSVRGATPDRISPGWTFVEKW